MEHPPTCKVPHPEDPVKPPAHLQDVMRFLCSPSAGDLRRLLVRELVNGLDLLLRDRLRRTVNSLPTMLAPKVPLFGPLPMPPAGPLLGLLPVFVPGLGVKSAQDVLALVAPTLDQREEVHLQSLIELVTGLAGALRACLTMRRLQRNLVQSVWCNAMCSTTIKHTAGQAIRRSLLLNVCNNHAGRQGTPKLLSGWPLQ